MNRIFLLVAMLMLNGAGLAATLPATVSNAAGASSTQNLGWWDDTPWGDPERGFNWYPDRVAPKVPEKKAEESKPAPKSMYEMNNFDDIQKAFKKIKEAAMLNPTEKNVVEFLKANAWMMEKSAVFADVARRTVWATPEVDYNNKSPVITASRQNQSVRLNEARRSSVSDISKEYGLLFFARSDCPYCHDQAPILKLFERNFGMSVMAVSMDGGPIPMFPDAKRDNGISIKVSSGAGIETVPAVYLVNRSTFAAIPLGSGVLAAEDVAERIRVLTRTRPGQEF
jgi:conjugal transfer pilus assembly protein TraF